MRIPAVYEDWLMGRFDFVSELSQEVDQVQGVRGSMVRPVGVVKLYDRPWPGDLDIVIYNVNDFCLYKHTSIHNCTINKMRSATKCF